jgi:hypothetical protein
VTPEAIEPGWVLHWDKFKLSDGTLGHKFFVVVGAKPDCDYLVIIATSQKKWNRNYAPGGDYELGWYHIPGDGKNFFTLPTWLLFTAAEQLSAEEVKKMVADGKLTKAGVVKPDIANGIMNCMRKCQDVSQRHIDLLGPTIRSQPKKL